ncbi:AsmA family protein [Jannaschia sp. KMU-145]|uniref:AsmA family protein n=1 Tax=Jannaschia halovivens TaxID=3388667 RepID=UPI00396B047D
MRGLVRAGVALIAVIVVAVVALVLLVPAERIADFAVERFEAETGRAMTIDGDVGATLWPRLGVRAEGVTVANADWAGETPMLTADAIEVGVPLAAVFGRVLRIETLEIEGATLVLERGADGRGNWEFGMPATPGGATPSATPGPAAPAPQPFGIDRATITGSDITWVDQRADRTVRLRAVDAALALPDADGPAEVTISALLAGQAVTVAGEIAQARDFLGGALTPVTLTLEAGGTRVSLDGRADLDPTAWEGRLSVVSTDRLAVMRALGLTPPDLPQGLGRGRLALDATATLAPAGSLHLRDMALGLDGNRLTGAVDLVPGDARPTITATLAADDLDLTPLSREGQGGETAIVAETGWAREAFDVSGLFLADGSLTLTAGTVQLGDATLDELRLRATVDQGRAVITLQPLVAYGSTVTGDLVVNGRGGLSARADLDLNGLEMAPFLTEFADFDRLVGQADASISLLGVGDTSAELMASLDGGMTFRMGQGEILGLDVAGMIRNLDPNFRGEGQKTVIDGMSVSFSVADGVARSDDLALDAPLLTATGEGSVDLGGRTLSYRLMPTLRVGGITVPILIEGPWSDPRIRPDLEFLARQELEIERAELEARARAEADAARARAESQARDRLAEELEVAPEILTDRGALEDAIRDRVEEQLLDLLLGR